MGERCWVCSRLLTGMNHETGKDICYNCDGIKKEKEEEKNVRTNQNHRN